MLYIILIRFESSKRVHTKGRRILVILVRGGGTFKSLKADSDTVANFSKFESGRLFPCLVIPLEAPT